MREDYITDLASAYRHKVAHLRSSGRGHCAAVCRDCLLMTLDLLEAHLLKQLTVREAAQLTGRSPSQIRRWMRQGKISRLGGNGERLRTRRGDLIQGRAHYTRQLLAAIQDAREAI